MVNSTYPVWTEINRAPTQYPWLDDDISCDVCVVGGGVTGAMCAMRLAESGADVVMITKTQVGAGATASIMPCVEYDCGYTLRELGRRAGETAAARLLSLGLQSLDGLENLSVDCGGAFGFARRDAMLYTDDRTELELINREYLARRREGFDCSYVSHSAARDVFPFEVAGAIISKGMAAELDPYRLTHICAERAAAAGARIFENTMAEQIDSDGEVFIETSTHRAITAKHTVIAAGSACADIVEGVSNQRTGFLVASAPAAAGQFLPGRCVIRSWSSPSVTFAGSPDGRVFAGGLTTALVDDEGRFGGIIPAHKLCNRRFDELEAGARYIFQGLSDEPFEHANVVRYCETADRMPIIGESDKHPGCIFAVCPASNAALMSELASRMVAEIAAGGYPDELDTFAPYRKSLSRG